ncbi:spore cortex-lytic protein [Pseudoflavonifractor phocaeensis]|uniref:spore cortex-lytic protein n=1 Tax=Pseudoflavonifractor phocaeensis TaxID=1870988 RepID=UPI00313B81BB
MSQPGTITAHVYTSRAQIPVAGATVAVSQRLGGKRHTLLAIRVTDENGEIPPIPVPAPQGSETPGKDVPFSSLDVRVEHPDYQMEIIEGIQIFPGISSLQEVQLIPLAEHAIPRNTYHVVNITPQPL